MKEMAEEFKKNKELLEKETKMREDLQKQLGKITNERNDLRGELDGIQDLLDEAEFRAEQLQQQKVLLETKVNKHFGVKHRGRIYWLKYSSIVFPRPKYSILKSNGSVNDPTVTPHYSQKFPEFHKIIITSTMILWY